MTAQPADRIMLVPREQLVSHPKNAKFFQPLSGDDWQLFLDDVAERGILEPLLVTEHGKDLYRIVAGHNRLAAATELDIELLPCVLIEYENEDAEIDDLIRSNVQRRQLNPFTKVRLAAELLGRIQSRQGERTDRTSVPMEQKSEPPREQIARELAMHSRDISAARLFAGLPEEAKAVLARWAEENDPNKKQLRERIKEMSAKLAQVERRERQFRRRAKDLEELEKREKQIREDEVKFRIWQEKHSEDVALVTEANRVFEVVRTMRDFYKEHVSEIAYMTLEPEALELCEKQVGDLLHMIDDLRRIISERFVERLWAWRKEQMDNSPSLFDPDQPPLSIAGGATPDDTEEDDQ